MIILIILIAGIVPMIVYPLFIYWMDRYEKEPFGLLAAAFLWGFIPAAILSLIAQLILEYPFLYIDGTGALADLVGGVILAPVTEEIFKGIAVLIIFLLWQNEFDGIFDGIIYGSLVGFGFASIENVLYFADNLGGDLGFLIFLRAFLFGLNHALFTSLTGIGFGIARHTRNPFWRYLAPLLGLTVAIAIHALHNFSVGLAEEFALAFCAAVLADWGGVLIVLLIMILSVRRERQWILDQLREEVGKATLSQAQYEVACSPTQRISARLSAFMSGGISRWMLVRRYFHILTELAYKKHAFDRRGEAGASLELISDLRTRVAALSIELNALFT